jgi:DNA-binding transcriptional regulator YdaS (Cro superfamily)
MKTVYDIRRENLQRLLEEPGSKTALALKLDVVPGRITHMLTGHRKIHEDTARAIEGALGLSARQLDCEPGSASTDAVDFDMLIEAVAVALEYLRAEGIPIDKEKATKIAKAVYAYGQQAGGINAQAIRPLLKMLL